MKTLLIALVLLTACKKERLPVKWKGIPEGKTVECVWQPNNTNLGTCIVGTQVFTCISRLYEDEKTDWYVATCAPQTQPLPAEIPAKED